MPFSRNLRGCSRTETREKVQRVADARAVAGPPHLLANANYYDDPAMRIYLEGASEYEAEFGHPFASDDGWDEHFKQMAFHERTAKALATNCGNDAEKIAWAASQPLIFEVHNPFPVDDPRRTHFDAKMRGYARALDSTLPLPDPVGSTIPFRIVNCYADYPDMRLRQHCRSVPTQSPIAHRKGQLNTLTTSAYSGSDPKTANLEFPEHALCLLPLRGMAALHPAIEAVIRARPSPSDGPGTAYVFTILADQPNLPHPRPKGRRELKIGKANDPPKRKREWSRQCRGQRQEWRVYWIVPFTKKFEKLLHAHFKHTGAWIPPKKCRFCGVRHREKFGFRACGGVRGVKRTAEFYLRVLAWPIIRIRVLNAVGNLCDVRVGVIKGFNRNFGCLPYQLDKNANALLPLGFASTIDFASVPIDSCFALLRSSEDSRGRRHADHPYDKYLDFDTQVTVMLWIKNRADPLPPQENTEPVQIVLYPREDLRVRLCDHKLALSLVGFEQQEFQHPARYYCDGGAGKWWNCAWNTPLKISGPGDTILLAATGLFELKRFEIHEPHLRALDASPTYAGGLTEASKSRRRKEYTSDSLLDFNTPVATMIWLQEEDRLVQLILYPREDLRVRLCDHTPALAAIGFQPQDGGLVERFHRQEGAGSWWTCTWETPLKVSGAGDTLLLCNPGIQSLQDFSIHEPHIVSISYYYYNQQSMHPLLQTVISAPPSASDKPGGLYIYEILDDEPELPASQQSAGEVKYGRAKNPPKRRFQWLRQCRGQRQRWWCYWQVPFATKFVMVLAFVERIVHTHFKLKDAWLGRTACDFCPVQHQEKYDLDACGGRTAIIQEVESLIRVLGWPVIRGFGVECLARRYISFELGDARDWLAASRTTK
ncbi:hypothetical protein FB451DRAFT_1190871 [Mycena latifolia]|nr:hypothetical protein FB451DRAFT_1190871 [Mycena latifolia]